MQMLDSHMIGHFIRILHVFTGPNFLGVLITQGMEQFNMPNLMIKNVPAFMAPAGCHILNDAAASIVNMQKLPKEDDVWLSEGISMPYRIVQAVPPTGHEYIILGPTLELIADPDDYPICDNCKKGIPHDCFKKISGL